MAKREANAQRPARERERQAILSIARGVAIAVATGRVVGEKKEVERTVKFLDGIGVNSVHLDAKWIKSESIENIAKGLRLAADIFERKPMDGRTFTEHDSQIGWAFLTQWNE
jgi:hypothetical protein